MLETLERGPKNGVWHSLIDKVYAVRTLWAAWEKVQANGGAGGCRGGEHAQQPDLHGQ